MTSTSIPGAPDNELEKLAGELPECQDDIRVREVAAQKRERLREWLDQRGLDGVVISRRDHFAWLTAGGDNRVLNNSEVGFGHLVVTPNRQYLVAHSMDACRLLDEQVPGQGYELVEVRWHRGDPRHEAIKLAGARVAADTSFPGAKELDAELAFLHFPLSQMELLRSRWLARQVGIILEDLARWVQPGMTEAHIARQMQVAFALASVDLDVLIVGSDERIFKYRHPLPSEKPVEKYILLHPAACRWGLHANVSRSLHFGPPPAEVLRAYQAAATIEGRIFSVLSSGLPFSEILALQKSWYAELGFPSEWEFHFQGGPTGYRVVDATRCLTQTAVEIDQAFDWFVTITGAKVEELSLLTAQGVEIASMGDIWPKTLVETSHGSVAVPDLYLVGRGFM